jgi:uncharacterized cofD-like protein
MRPSRVGRPSGGMRPTGLRRWLVPGIGVKRWLLLVFLGLVLLALGVAHFLRQATANLEPGGLAQMLLDAATLQFLPYPLRGLLAGLAGLGCVGFGAWRLARALTDPLRASQAGEDQPLVDVIYQQRFLARGPRIVAIGGGTGLSTLLRGLKGHTSNLTAIVTVADDGGSSGALRAELGIPPVGDIRNCIAALADAEPQMADLLGYRFPGGADVPGSADTAASGGLAGHALGNLLLAALTELESGDFEEAVRRMNRVLAVRGRVVPASPTPVTLHARTRDGATVLGQSAVMRTRDIERAWITPDDVRASRDAVAAIEAAEIVVMGPGSLYTSVLPVLLIPEIRDAVAASGAIRVYVCNVAMQAGETEAMDLADHVEALLAHTGPGLIDVVLANDRLERAGGGPGPVALRWPPAADPVPHLATDDVVDGRTGHHHDPERLAVAILRACEREAAAVRRERVARST